MILIMIQKNPIKKQRLDCLTKYNNTGCGCGRKVEAKGFHLDHIIPLASGGTNDNEKTCRRYVNIVI